MERKIYNENMVRLSAFLGGPLVGAYLMAENYRTFGQEKEARRVLQIGAGVSILIFGILFSLPEPAFQKFPKFLIPLLSAFAANFMVRKYQAISIENYLAEGGQQHSNLKVAGVSVVILAVEIAVAALVFFCAFRYFE